MRVDRARAIAEAWVREQGASLPGFKGALLHGSILELADDAELAARLDAWRAAQRDRVPERPTDGSSVR